MKRTVLFVVAAVIATFAVLPALAQAAPTEPAGTSDQHHSSGMTPEEMERMQATMPGTMHAQHGPDMQVMHTQHGPEMEAMHTQQWPAMQEGAAMGPMTGMNSGHTPGMSPRPAGG